MGYKIKSGNDIGAEYGSYKDLSTWEIVEKQKRKYRDLEGKGVHRFREFYDVVEDEAEEPYNNIEELYEEFDIDGDESYDPDELVEVDDDWEEMLERHAAAEGYDL